MTEICRNTAPNLQRIFFMPHQPVSENPVFTHAMVYALYIKIVSW